MRLFDSVNQIANMIISATVFVVIILAVLAYYLFKKKKIASAEENLHYDSFDRMSSMEYVKFDDIVSDSSKKGMDGAGMLVIDRYTFVSCLEIVGYNYEHASAEEKQRTMVNAIAFVNIIEQPIQMRQTVEAVDVKFNIEEFQAARAELARQRVELVNSYNDLLFQADNPELDMEVKESILGTLEQLDVKITSIEWKIQEADEVIRYEESIQKQSTNTDRINQILISYVYNPDEYTETLSDEEIKQKAMHQLKTKMSIYSNALANCGCSCKPVTADELVALFRRHMHPNTADSVNVSERIDIELNQLFVSSDSLYELERERVGDRMFSEMISEMDREYEEAVETAAAEIEAQATHMEAVAESYDEEIEEELLQGGMI